MVIGAPVNNDSIGAAYEFDKPASGWKNTTETVKVTPSDGQKGDAFGLSIVLDKSGLFVGSPLHMIPPDHRGAIYVFDKE